MRSNYLIFVTFLLLILSLSMCKNPSGGGDGGDNKNEMHQLTIEINPNQGGSVSPSGGEFEDGETETLEASPASGWEFDSWSGDINTTENPYQITINNDMEITANFSENSQPEAFTGEMTVTDADRSRELVFAIETTSGISEGLDDRDYESPPVAPPNAFFTGFIHEGMNLYEDYRPADGSTEEVIWEIRLNRRINDDMNLQWNLSNSIDNGDLLLVNNVNDPSPSIEVDMLTESSYSVADPSTTSLFIVYSTSKAKDVISNINTKVDTMNTYDSKKSVNGKLKTDQKNSSAGSEIDNGN